MKEICANGHINPQRTKRRQCVECRNESNRKRKRKLKWTFQNSFALVNAIRHMLGLDDLPWEARCE